jgi:hypothetical protein
MLFNGDGLAGYTQRVGNNASRLGILIYTFMVTRWWMYDYI